VESLVRLGDEGEVFAYAAGGFRDFTRIASSDPVMWRDICLANGDAIQLMIEHFVTDLQELTAAIQNRDGTYLLELFTSARDARDRYVDK
jgi:prephenate dehydrogenase